MSSEGSFMTSSLTQKGSNVACLAAQWRVLLFLPQLPNSETFCQQVETVGYESNPALSALEPVKKEITNKQRSNSTRSCQLLSTICPWIHVVRYVLYIPRLFPTNMVKFCKANVLLCYLFNIKATPGDMETAYPKCLSRKNRWRKLPRIYFTTDSYWVSFQKPGLEKNIFPVFLWAKSFNMKQRFLFSGTRLSVGELFCD